MRRNFGLDVLRCLAITMVLANHGFLGFFVELGQVPWSGWRAALSILTFISIEWLFVLSGFLIGAMMIRSFESESTWWPRARSFWLRRWFRTVPNYYLFLGVNIAISVWLPVPGAGTGKVSAAHFVFAQNLFRPERLPLFFNEAWTLALDEWFYLLMPILVGLGSRRAGASLQHAFAYATATLILAPFVLRLVSPLPVNPFAWDLSFRRVTILHLDATGWGVLAALTSRWWPAFWQRNRTTKAILGGSLMALGILSIEQYFFDFIPGAGPLPWLTAWPRFAPAFSLTLTAAGTFLAFPWIASHPAPTGRWARMVESISNYTYSIYLSHFPLLYILATVWGRAGWVSINQLLVAALVWVICTLALSATVFHVFEKPVSDLRERYTKRVAAHPF